MTRRVMEFFDEKYNFWLSQVVNLNMKNMLDMYEEKKWIVHQAHQCAGIGVAELNWTGHYKIVVNWDDLYALKSTKIEGYEVGKQCKKKISMKIIKIIRDNVY